MPNGKNGTLLRWVGLVMTLGMIVASIGLSYGALAARQADLAEDAKQTQSLLIAESDKQIHTAAAVAVLQSELAHVRENLSEIKAEQKCIRQGLDEIKDLLRTGGP